MTSLTIRSETLLSETSCPRQASPFWVTVQSTAQSATATSPLQYLESIRLHRARLMMVHAGHDASTAAVGYESASQFGREFKRLFGTSPADAAMMRARPA